MTTLIFATLTDASPMIYLTTTPEAVRRYLTECRPVRANPGRVAGAFLHGLSPDQYDDWNPTIESTPISNINGMDDEIGSDDIAWNPETWSEWPLTAPVVETGFGERA